MPKLVSIDDQSYAALTLQSLRVASQSTSFPLRHWNLRNLTLHQECYLTTGMLPYKHSSRSLEISTRLHSTFARLYNAAASPASRLRSAGSLAITDAVFRSKFASFVKTVGIKCAKLCGPIGFSGE